MVVFLLFDDFKMQCTWKILDVRVEIEDCRLGRMFRSKCAEHRGTFYSTFIWCCLVLVNWISMQQQKRMTSKRTRPDQPFNALT